VLVIEWNDAGEVRVVGFRRGEWEGKLIALLPRASADAALIAIRPVRLAFA